MPDTSADDAHWEALARYLAGESSPDEIARMQRLLAEEPDRKAAMDALAAMMQRLELPQPAGIDVDAAWRRTRDRMPKADAAPAAEPHRVAPAPLRVQSSATRRRLALILTGALAATLVGVVLWNRLVPATRTVVTTTGQRDSVAYPDGSRILLGPGSRLVIDAPDDGRPSRVRLEGEAYFDIPHDPDRPFRVEAGSLQISDLGTRFNVRHHVTGATEVEVGEGSVGLARKGSAPVVLQAGDRGVHLGAGDAQVTRAAVSAEAPAWTEGRLVFSDTPFARVAEDLHRWFGITLVTDDSLLAGRHFTASFQGESARDVVRILALATGSAVEWRGDTASLLPSAARPAPQ